MWFQSTLPTRGSDLTYQPFHFLVLLFQSTLPTRGSDGVVKGISWYSKEFQSTLPTRGSDIFFTKAERAALTVSIHAPHEGERPLVYVYIIL